MKDYRICLYREGTLIYETAVKENFQRLNILDLPEAVETDTAELHILATHGCADVRVFEIRLY